MDTLQQAPAHERPKEPIAGYSVLLTVFGVAAGAALWAGRHRLQTQRFAPSDLILLGTATYKTARLLTKDRVTAPLREPFVTNRVAIGHGEVDEDARGEGLRCAIGKLVTCPYCAAPYVATGWSTAWSLNPPLARALASVVSMVAIADTLQLLDSLLKKRS